MKGEYMWQQQNNVIDAENCIIHTILKMTLNNDFYGRWYSHKTKDLCPECKDSFDEWLFAGKPVGEVKKEDKHE